MRVHVLTLAALCLSACDVHSQGELDDSATASSAVADATLDSAPLDTAGYDTGSADPLVPVCYPGQIIWYGGSQIGCTTADSTTCGTTMTKIYPWNDGTCSVCVGSSYVSTVTAGNSAGMTVGSSTSTAALDLSCLACVSPPSSLAGWWTFDDVSSSSSTFADRKYTSDGTRYGASGTTGKVNTALKFDGVDDYAVIGDATGLDADTHDFTVDAWVKVNTTSGTQVILDKRTYSSGKYVGYHVYLYGGKLGLQLADGSGTTSYSNYVSSGTVPADGNWHFIAITVDRDVKAGIQFYVDGSWVSSADPTGRTASLGNTADIRLGVRSPAAGGGGYLNGSLDELEFFNRALSGDEIESLYDAGAFGKCRS